MRVVLDTNVLVSALLSPLGHPKKILNLVLTGDLLPLFDERILSEYREVLWREELRLPRREVAEVLSS